MVERLHAKWDGIVRGLESDLVRALLVTVSVSGDSRGVQEHKFNIVVLM